MSVEGFRAAQIGGVGKCHAIRDRRPTLSVVINIVDATVVAGLEEERIS
jgi:hypothetical protein